MLAAGSDEVNLFDEEFTDDKTNFEDQAPSDYRLKSFTRDLADARRDDREMAEELSLIDPDPQSFVPDCIDEIEFEYDEFRDFEKRISKFEQDLKIYELDSKDSFFYAVLYGIYYFYCGHMPGIIYKFGNQNIQTFFNNVKFMGDLPFSIYFNSETTSGKKVYHFDGDATL